MVRYCLQCDDGTVLAHGQVDVSACVRGREHTVAAVSGWHCTACGEVEFDPGEGERYSAALEALGNEIAIEEAALLRTVRKRAHDTWFRDQVRATRQRLATGDGKMTEHDTVFADLRAYASHLEEEK